MSVSFQGVGTSLDLSNGAADRLLQAIGVQTTEETAGSLLLSRAQEGIRKARYEAMDVEMLRWIWELSDLVEGLVQARESYLRWF